MRKFRLDLKWENFQQQIIAEASLLPTFWGIKFIQLRWCRHQKYIFRLIDWIYVMLKAFLNQQFQPEVIKNGIITWVGRTMSATHIMMTM